jgi:hypothetical protein
VKEEKKKALEELIWPEIFVDWLEEAMLHGEIRDNSI